MVLGLAWWFPVRLSCSCTFISLNVDIIVGAPRMEGPPSMSGKPGPAPATRNGSEGLKVDDEKSAVRCLSLTLNQRALNDISSCE